MFRTVSFCLEINSSMSNDVEEEGGKVDSQEVAQESSAKDNEDQDCGIFSTEYFRNIRTFHKILGKLFWSKVLENIRLQLIKGTGYLK